MAERYTLPTSRPSRYRLAMPDRLRALKLLADTEDGATSAILLAHGIPSALIAELISDGLATAHSKPVLAGGRTVTLIKITDAGRRELGG